MNRTFSIAELEDVVKPHELIDVLDVLVANGLLWGYDMSFMSGTVTLDLPKHTEVASILRELTEAQTSGKVRKDN